MRPPFFVYIFTAKLFAPHYDIQGNSNGICTPCIFCTVKEC